MNAPHTVTVHTIDHGPVVLPEPAWCLGRHPAGGYRVDITHEGEEKELAVPTSSGPLALLRACFEQRPFTEAPPGRAVFLDVQMNGDWYPYGPAGLEELASALDRHAAELRSLARMPWPDAPEGGRA